ncbi:MAG TPA: glutamine--fructose-6-phosphate transaminase (isomerizing) [Pseudomonadales bacterium]
MCGIVGAIARRDVPGILLEGLKRLEYRGYDSAGLAVIPHGCARIERRRRVGKVKELSDSLRADPLFGHVGIAHTRWATHGAPLERNAHPHMSRDRICVVHNGIIENFEQIRSDLKRNGYEFDSETDSEVIAHLVESLQTDGRSLVDAVRLAIKHLEGAYAIGVMSRDEPDRLVGARVGSPLVVGIGIGENFLASDVLALRPVTDRFVFLEEGDLVEITADGLTVWSVDAQNVVRATVRVQLGSDDVDKGNYRHHMLKEIHEQPKVVRDTLEGRLTKTRVLEPAFGVKAPAIFDRVKSVTIVACGSSFYTASIARYWIESVAELPCQVEIASEYRYRGVAVPPDALFVTISQSGETADTLAALRMAKTAGYAATLTFCNVATSSIVRESDIALMLEAGPEIGVASTKAFTAQLVDLVLLTILLARRRGLTRDREAALVAALHGLPGVIDEALRLDTRIAKLAERFIDRRHALFLGRGSLYPVALEGALKLKEISYIHAEGYPAGELKHGPLALVDEDMPVVAVAPNDDLLSKLASNLQVVRARGGELFVFADRNSGYVDGPGVTVIPVPSVHEMLAPIVYTIPLQLLAYHAAVLKGTDVDQPRNLAKSVTVE